MPTRKLLSLCFALLALGLAACGTQSVREERAQLVKDCTNGNSGDKVVCECIAAQLSEKHGIKTAKGFEDINKEVKAGKQPKVVIDSLKTCQERQGPTG